MKSLYLIIVFAAFLLVGNQVAFAQCIPGDAVSCPDPENNGEICPDTLSPVFVGVEYNQVATILAPPKLDTNGITIPLHHITLVTVDNLPEGISWQSNAPDNEFMVGTYYCILLSGTSAAPVGKYPLKIVVDVYTQVGTTPVLLGQSVDSTSLAIDVKWDPNGIHENDSKGLISKVYPNPFVSEISIELNQQLKGKVEVELFDITGNRLYYTTISNNNTAFKIELPDLPKGIYLFSLKNKGRKYLKTLTRID